MRKNGNFQSGIQLCLATLLLFFGLYFWYANDISVSNEDYLRYSAIIISFILPILYTFFGLREVMLSAKETVLNFRQAFRKAFLPQIIAGLLSISIIFIFFNTTGSWAENRLEQTLIENFSKNQDFKQNPELKTIVENLEKTNINLFSIGNYAKFIPVLVVYYLIISTILALFMKNRRV